METRTPDSTSWLRGLRAALANRTLGLDALRTPEERRLAGRMTGLLYLLGAVSSVIVALLPSVARSYTAEVLAVAAAGGIWGVAALTVVRWETTRPWVTHASTTCGLGIAAALMAMTGGAESPARFYLFFIVVYAAYFYSLREAVVYFLGCGLILSLPFLYDASALHFSFYGEVLIAIPTYFVLGYVILAGKQRLVDQRERADRLAAEQGALQRVATAVARARPRDEVYALVAEEVSRLLAADAAGIVRFESETECLVVGSWSPEGNGAYAAGTRFPVRPSSNVEHLLHTGEAVHTDEHPAGSPARALGHPASLIAPVHVNERLWGLVGVMGDEPYDDADENRLSAFADLIATSVANTEAQAKLAHQASTDPLTGLLNHRSFHERLRTEVRRAQRYGRTLSLAVVDVDNFKHVNDLAGHEAGDRVLADVAERLGSIARAEDVFARIGGDEFALLLPETDRMQALAALERARQVVAATPFDVGHMTISAGICDMESASDADAMFRLADGALYWSKAHGRDVVWIYDPETVRELSAEERAEHLERGAALRGLRALARAIDAKDPTTRRHSERVAALATELAKASGWDTERVGRLHEAALVHDVGKIGVPDAVLTKPGPLTEEEYEQTKQHAALSTQIVAEVLDEEQTAWVAAHHERPDGRGYPHGLRADRIPAGAALLAVADAWDVMTVSRPYSVPKSSDEALEECRGLAGAQFTSEAIEALLATHAAGSLERLMAGVAA